MSVSQEIGIKGSTCPGSHFYMHPYFSVAAIEFWFYDMDATIVFLNYSHFEIMMFKIGMAEVYILSELVNQTVDSLVHKRSLDCSITIEVQLIRIQRVRVLSHRIIGCHICIPERKDVFFVKI